MIDRRSILNFDLTLLITVVLIFVLGVINLYSSAYPHTGITTPLFVKQVYWFLIGVGLVALIILFDYRTFIRYAYPFYLFCLLLLILVMFFGRTASGSQRWLQLGFFSFQPSELT